jgi:Tol biopolymer transport system component
MGTPAYMSPEQVRGDEATRQSDVWAFGVILFELLTGTRPFQGSSQSDVLAAVLQTTPDWSVLPRETPPGVRRLVQRCLEREPKARLHDIGDARLEIEDAEKAPWPTNPDGLTAPHAADSRRLSSPLVLALGGLIALAAVALGGYVAWIRPGAPPAETVRLQLAPPPGTRFVSVPAVSPDGRLIVLVTRPLGGGEPRLWLRRLAGVESTELPGTEGEPSYPFWSPDSRSVAFFANNSLKRLDLSSSAPVVIASAPAGRGGLWLDDDTIVYAPTGSSPLMRVGAAGGQSQPFTTLAEDETGHRFPQRLPGRQLLYFSVNHTPENSGSRIVSVDEPGRTVNFVPSQGVAEYANGHLLVPQGEIFARRMVAQRVSLPDGQLLGDPIDVAGIRISETLGRYVTATSANGVVAILPPEAPKGQLTWISRDGRVLDSIGTPDTQYGVELSPSRREVATFRDGDIWTIDLARPVANKVTRGFNLRPVWSPDGTRIATRYQGRGIGTFDLEITSVATGNFTTLLEATQGGTTPLAWTRDGQTLVFEQNAGLWTIGLGDPRKATSYLVDGARNLEARLSPDDKWLAYATDRSGRFEIEVRSFPVPGPRYVVSLEGGGYPRWRADGRELYFLAGTSRLMAVAVTPGDPPRFSAPTQLVDVELVAHPTRGFFDAFEYDVAADGSRFLVNRLVSPSDTNMTIIVNWSPTF